MRRGQINSKIFTYMLGVVIVGIVLILGYRMINKTTEAGKSAMYESFKNEFEIDVNQIYQEYGSLRKVSYDLPKDITRVCMLDKDNKNEVRSSLSINNYPILKEGLDTDDNIFVYKEGSFFDSFQIDKIKFNHYPYFKCFDIKNSDINFGIEGMGKKALVLTEFSSSAVTQAGKVTKFSSPDGLVELKIPADSVPEGTEVGIEIMERQGPNQATEVYNFTPSGLEFNPPLELTMKYFPEVLGGNDCPNELIFKYEYEHKSPPFNFKDFKAEHPGVPEDKSVGEINCNTHTAKFYIDEI